MRSVLSLIVLLLIATMSVSAQSFEKQTPNWEEIEKIAQENPDKIKDLARRLTSPLVDESLSIQDLQLAYFGSVCLSNGSEMLPILKARRAVNQDSIKQALKLIDEALAINPLSLAAISNKARWGFYDMRKNNNQDITEADVDHLLKTEQMLTRAIVSTGDGTKDNPFYISSVDDEYVFMNDCMGISKDFIKQQSLVRDDNHACDKFTLNKQSQYYPATEVYFEVTQVLKLQQRLFNPSK